MAMSRWQFVCSNDACKHKNHGFVFLCPWPLGNIDTIINSKKVSRDNDFKAKLEELKKSGREYTCIQYPDFDNIPVMGYRVHLWCDKCTQLSEFDLMISDTDKERMVKESLCANDEEIVKNTINNANLPKECPVCKDILVTYEEIFKRLNITCPSCKTKSMKVPNVWFANEKFVR